MLWGAFADTYFLARDFAHSVAVSEEALQLYPHDWALHRSLAKALTALGDANGALRLLRRASLFSPGAQVALHADMAYVHALTGRADAAAKFLTWAQRRPLGQPVLPIDVARIYLALGNKERAIDCLEEACARRDWYISDLKQDIRLDPLRTVPRFRSLLTRVGV